jgi:hypothetical protein
MFPDGLSIQSHSGGSFNITDSALAMQTMIHGIHYVFHCQTITAQEELIVCLKSEDAAGANRLHFQADINVMILTAPTEPSPGHSYTLSR